MSSTPSKDTGPGVGEVRTYRGRSVEELVPQIRAELGAGAIILREREGVTGGVGGFFAQRCVEIDAQAPPRVSVYADDLDDDAAPELDEERELDEAEFEAAAAPRGFAARLREATVTPPPAPPAAPTPDVFAAFTADDPVPTTPDPLAAPAPPAPVATPGFIAFDELDDDTPPAVASPVPEPPGSSVPAVEPPESPVPAVEPTEIPVPVVVAPAPVAASVFRPQPAAAAPPREPALSAGELVHRLTERGVTPAFAESLVADAAALVTAGSAAGLAAAVQATLAAALPTPTPLPLAGGAVAVVGSGGTGKTRAVAGLAAACARAGHTVAVAQLGSPERALELAELLRGQSVEVLPAMRTRATARAVDSARERGLVLVDTTSASTGDRSAVEVLAETLEPFALDGVLLAVPTTFGARAAAGLAESFSGLPVGGLIATHVDELDALGAIAELAIATGIGVGHAHSGLDVAGAVRALDPATLAGRLAR